MIQGKPLKKPLGAASNTLVNKEVRSLVQDCMVQNGDAFGSVSSAELLQGRNSRADRVKGGCGIAAWPVMQNNNAKLTGPARPAKARFVARGYPMNGMPQWRAAVAGRPCLIWSHHRISLNCNWKLDELRACTSLELELTGSRSN